MFFIIAYKNTAQEQSKTTKYVLVEPIKIANDGIANRKKSIFLQYHTYCNANKTNIKIDIGLNKNVVVAKDTNARVSPS